MRIIGNQLLFSLFFIAASLAFFVLYFLCCYENTRVEANIVSIFTFFSVLSEMIYALKLVLRLLSLKQLISLPTFLSILNLSEYIACGVPCFRSILLENTF